MKRILLLICGFVLFLGVHPAQSQSSGNQQAQTDLEMKIQPREVLHFKKLSEAYTKGYRDIVDELHKGELRNGRIRTLRTFYPKTDDYTPFSKSIINRMTALAYMADTSTDQTQVNDALSEYRDLLNKHIANFDVITFALTMARANVMFGDSIMLKAVRDALIDDLTSMVNVGDTPERAYIISTYGEETFILEQMGATVKKSDIFKVGRSYYHVHDVENAKGEFQQVYTNITDPIRSTKLKQLVRKSEERKTLPLIQAQ